MGAGSTVATPRGSLTLDVASEIILDADDGVWRFKDDGTEIFNIANDSSDVHFNAKVSDKDIVFRVNDGGVTRSAMTINADVGGRIDLAQPTDNASMIITNSAEDCRIQLLATASNKNSRIELGDNGDDNIGMIDYDHNDNSLAFTVNTEERLRIKSNGTIQTTTTGTNNTRLGEDAGAAIVSGNDSNVLIGDNAGASLTSPASFNIAVGHLALDADTKGDQSVAIGYTALSNQNFTSTADANNIAIGYQAGVDLSTGQNNVFIGVGAAASSSSNRLSGDRNVAIGTNALNVVQGIGAENIAIGAFAGDNITTALHNVLIGDQAYSGTSSTGSGNIGIGHNALQNSTATDNVAIGNGAALALTGNDNVILGVDAAAAASSITQCVIIGANAGSAATMTGDNNTVIGRAAGNALTSGSENTFVGAEAGDGGAGQASNTAVGYRALSANAGNQNVAVGEDAAAALTGK